MSLTEYIGFDGGVHFLVLVGRINVVEHNIGVYTDLRRLMHGADHRLQLSTATETCLGSTFLIVVSEVVVVVDAITVIHDTPVTLRGYRCPDGGDATRLHLRSFRAKRIPPRAILVGLVNRYIPIECLHHNIVERLETAGGARHRLVGLWLCWQYGLQRVRATQHQHRAEQHSCGNKCIASSLA